MSALPLFRLIYLVTLGLVASDRPTTARTYTLS